MFCPEDGADIGFEQAEETPGGTEVRYPKCPKCGARWTYLSELSVGPCYVLEVGAD